jgi:sugar lactone lactonase YvrE
MKDGTVQWRRSDWTLVKIITSSTDGQAKGMVLDASGNLFVTHYFGTGLSGNNVVKFDPNGNLIGSFGSHTYDCNPASIVFDMGGNAYVGHADCSGNIFKLDSHGNLLARYDVAVENRGSSHILLGPDQCTMYYTSESPNVKRFNVCTNTQMPDFNTAPLPDGIEGAEQFALLPGGGLLVANFSVIARLDASGNLVRTYNAPGNTHCWLGMALDTDGTSFWASNWCDSSATRFDLATGNTIESHVASDTEFMVKQIMVVPSGPDAGVTNTATVSGVVINTATVSGGGEVNYSNDSASDSTTILTQTPAPRLSISSTAYCVGSAWSLGLSNAVPNALVRLMGTTNGQSWMVAPWATTDANGSLSQGGTFANGTQGSYTLRVDDGKVSNTIYFVVSNCGQ